LFVALSIALSFTSTAAADPILTAIQLAPQDTGGGGTGVAPAQPPASPPAAPMLADVAGPARPIGLPELLQLAVRQAPALAQAQIDIEIAEAEIEGARAWADWAVGAQLAASTRSAAGGGYSRVDTVSLSGDVTKMISTGGTVGLHAEGGLQRQSGGDFPAINQLGEVVTVRFNQPLMRGRGQAQLEAAERIARHSRDAAEISRRAAAIQLVQQVVLGYLDLVDAEKQLAIRRASLELAKERLRVTEAGIDKGGVARAETIPVEQAIATREGEVLGGEMTILQQSLELRRQVALPSAPGDMVLSSTVDLAIPSRTWSQAEIVAAAEASSPELARLAALEQGATISIEVTENGLLPQLDLGLSIGPSFLQDLGSTDTKADNDYSVGLSAGATLTYQQRLGQTSARASVRRARAQRHSIQVTATDVRNQIVEAVAVAVANIQVAERRYALAVRAVALGEQNLQVEQARLGLGKSRNVDVLQRQDELRSAQLQVQQTITDWHRSAAAIAALTGEILPQYGITLDAR
jgi:outer membrane protein TolC